MTEVLKGNVKKTPLQQRRPVFSQGRVGGLRQKADAP